MLLSFQRINEDRRHPDSWRDLVSTALGQAPDGWPGVCFSAFSVSDYLGNVNRPNALPSVISINDVSHPTLLEHIMRFQFDGDGRGFKVEVSGNWRQIGAFIRALAMLVALIVALRLAPQLSELATLLGL